MIDAPLALAFGAGLVATVNPCGFAMLPVYLTYYVGTGDDEAESGAVALRRALTVGAIVSAGFLVVFGLAGILITAGIQGVTDLIPWLALTVGAGIIILGIAMLFGFELTLGLPKAKKAPSGRSTRSIFTFGVSYAVASLSCTLPVFLSVVALQAQRTDFVSGLATHLAYGLGMSMLLIAVTIAVGLGRRGLVNRLRSSMRHINRVSGAILVAAGAYITWFWAVNLSGDTTTLGDSTIFRFFEDLSTRAIGFISNNALALGLGLGAAIAAIAVYAFSRGATDDEESADSSEEVAAPTHL